ncbi:helix-turn-helix transcriptional regulator [Pyxidicoccus fallax]|uniref:Helix-turn-helix transcriptional regulator n=1 Tax=Pyxidicoccus fallax TaxID=394095 RepID=A0A848LL30_9BACT|nr:helix-turn-helix domain-containing protein [Pyxidicoccus fallax]NMO18392.1 helix-turn-helix transcriptional regulator [Pyxidicoccus fallax]NPC81481.1 helix-turn-helix transcriptional regulator [Pyxidicoccus fallax]
MTANKQPRHLRKAMAKWAEQRGNLYAAACPSRGVLEHVTSRWGVLVLVALLEGTHRFSELRRKVAGVSEKMLAQTLHALEEDGFVLREVYPVIPPRVDYSLTPMGREVAEHMEVLTDWIEDNLPRVFAARAQHTPKKTAG